MEKSAYNFISAPEENEVFKPKWAKYVSHDIPFKDGESGEITIKITAQTPIYIRNGQKKNENDSSFSHININGKTQHFIPATSLKGVFRNVLEIFSFSRLNPALVDNNRYSYRDLTKDSKYLKKYKSKEVRAGWLEMDEKENWVVTKCENLYHIHHEKVDKLLDTRFKETFLKKNPKDRTAKWKYDQVKNNSLEITFSVENTNNKKLATEGSTHEGTIVFTGQASKRNDSKKTGKVYEFVFSKETVDKKLYISEELKKDFKFIYKDHDSNEISPDWKMWREKLKKEEKVPVFFNEENGKIKHFGLAYMYKLPYENKIHDLTPINSYTNGTEEPDLATTMFGSIEGEALKGRVMFTHAIKTNDTEYIKEKKEILAGPKASYYPFYLKEGDYNGEKAYLSGFKKYPVHAKIKKGNYSEKQKKNKNVFSKFRPLDKGAEFTAKIRFHNLKKVEIGALLSTLTFHGIQEECSHTLGGVKPLGYGKVKVEIAETKDLKYEIEDYLQTFEKQMNAHLKGGQWFKHTRIGTLIAMSLTNVSDEADKKLHYPKLKNEVGDNEFLSKELSLPTYKNATSNLMSVGLRKEEEENRKAEIAYNQIKDSQDINELERFIKEYEYSIYTNGVKNKISNIKLNNAISSLFSTDIDSLDNVESIEKELDLIKSFKDEYGTVTDYEKQINVRINELNAKKNQIKDIEKLKKLDIHFPEVVSFDEIKNVLNDVIKSKAFAGFDAQQKEQIKKAIENAWSVEKEKGKKNVFLKKKKFSPINVFPWTDVRKWLNEEEVKELYQVIKDKFFNS